MPGGQTEPNRGEEILVAGAEPGGIADARPHAPGTRPGKGYRAAPAAGACGSLAHQAWHPQGLRCGATPARVAATSPGEANTMRSLTACLWDDGGSRGTGTPPIPSAAA